MEFISNILIPILNWSSKINEKILLRDYKDDIIKALEDVPYTNTLSDIFDEKVIYDTNWQLYGSKKPDNIPYILKFVLDKDGNQLENKYLKDDYDTKKN